MMTNKTVGLYVHVPFCRSKCPYCDFYSHRADDETKERYAKVLIRTIKEKQEEASLSFSTVYFGGGTPSQLGSRLLCEILAAANVEAGAEVTAECNPSDVAVDWDADDVKRLADGGFNRISMGLQSAVDSERRKLGRRAGAAQAEEAVRRVRAAGISDYSLDLMLGIPLQTVETVKESARFIIESGAVHASAYLLSIEEGTPFEKVEKSLGLPDEDACCEQYLTACECFESGGLRQYEISNFARPGFESRHNLVYWDDREYLGVGAAAHSYMDGKRYYYPADTEAFIEGREPVPDGEGGGFEEYVMLRLRLTEGLTESGLRERFGFGIPEGMAAKAREYERLGKVRSTGDGFALTPRGFLVSNPVTADLIAAAQ